MRCLFLNTKFQISIYGWQLKSDQSHYLIYLNILFSLHRIENTVIETDAVAKLVSLVFKFIVLIVSKYLMSEMNQMFERSIAEIFVLRPKH